MEIIQKYKEKINFYQHKLDKNYGAHKNYGIELCKGKWIFQLDADEVPTDGLIENIDLIIETIFNFAEINIITYLNYRS